MLPYKNTRQKMQKQTKVEKSSIKGKRLNEFQHLNKQKIKASFKK